MGTQGFTEPGILWFITDGSTVEVAALERDARVNVLCAGKGGWVSPLQGVDARPPITLQRADALGDNR